MNPVNSSSIGILEIFVRGLPPENDSPARRSRVPSKPIDAGNPQSDLQDQLRRISEGDQEAAEELIRQVYPQVLRIVRRNLARRDSEEDVVQEILVKVLSSLASYKGKAPFEHWVSRIAVNACLNRLRAEQVRPEWRWADLPETQVAALDAVVAGKGLAPDQELSIRDVVNHLLENLSPQDRLIIRMMEIEGLTVKEICSRTGWSGTFIRVRAFRARQKLNRLFSEQWKRGEL